ncbi:MAG: sulfite exporter TauE/SafE family protein [Dehalococcoidales bacterium]|nr:sulfite exporter TauE/SafE family protein [Dehalococcoidales bacterium]
MSGEITILLGTAALLGFTHTVLGPDHYLPFIVLAKARQWSGAKTAFITFLCGIGHILSSVVLGFIGIALGIAVFKLEAIESFRGDFAGWLLLIFGFTYTVWGIHRALRNRPHEHPHLHNHQESHSHPHQHIAGHTHVHTEPAAVKSWASLTPWVLFTIFIFGPCEPLIPILMYPAANQDIASVALVATVFAAVTIGTMMTIVLASFYGLSRLPVLKLEKYSHAFAGFAILLCGIAIKFLGL